MPLGTTESGKDWCLKALHPSDPITEVLGIPDESSMPTAHLNFQSTFTVSPAVGATGTWEFNATLLPHPVNFMFLEKDDSTGPMAPVNFMNSQLTNDTHNGKYASLLSLAQRWRMSYMSVTAYQDGPDLANQGTLVAAQVPVSPLVLNASFGAENTGVCHALAHIHAYEASSKASFSTMQAMPNAYFGRSKEGLYAPMKLTRTHQKWTGRTDSVLHLPNLVGLDASRIGQWDLPAEPELCTDFPHVNILSAGGANGQAVEYGEATSPFLNDTVVHLSARNLAVTTSFTFFVRMGLEIQCLPSSPYSTHLKLSPAEDSVAISNYFAISRQLKDGYPADYNDLGKIWDVISGIAKQVGPLLAGIPVYGAPLSAAVTGAAGFGDFVASRIRSGATSGKKGTKGSAADVELAREAVKSRAKPARKQKKLTAAQYKRLSPGQKTVARAAGFV